PAIDAVQKEFCFELERGLATLIEAPQQAVVTVVGAAGTRASAIAGGVFGALARHGISLNGFSQGTSARCVACVVEASERSRAVRIIHRELFEAERTLGVALFGVGQVGGAVLRELADRHPLWRARGAEVTVIAVADSRRCALAADGLDLAGWREALRRSDCASDPRAIAATIKELALSNVALVD